jgi:hypothetical protein
LTQKGLLASLYLQRRKGIKLLKVGIVLLILAMPLIGAGCSSQKQSDASAAKEWQKQPVPPDYIQLASKS